jgi:hypothetical protein
MVELNEKGNKSSGVRLFSPLQNKEWEALSKVSMVFISLVKTMCCKLEIGNQYPSLDSRNHY